MFTNLPERSRRSTTFIDNHPETQTLMLLYVHAICSVFPCWLMPPKVGLKRTVVLPGCTDLSRATTRTDTYVCNHLLKVFLHHDMDIFPHILSFGTISDSLRKHTSRKTSPAGLRIKTMSVRQRRKSALATHSPQYDVSHGCIMSLSSQNVKSTERETERSALQKRE